MALTAATVLKRTLLAAAAALAVVYAADFASLRWRGRHASASDPLETLTTPRVYAIPDKDGKTEYEIDAVNPQQTVTCVHALFPHDGYAPCWRVKRTLHDPIPM